MGVISNSHIPQGRTFGPIPKGMTLVDPLYLIGHMTSDTRTDVHTVKLSLGELESSGRLGEWVPYLQAARDGTEQNLSATLVGGELHYRCCTEIQPGEEMLVWYDEDVTRLLQLPDMDALFMEGTSYYVCPYCSDKFQYPFPIRAHIRFKCTVLRQYFFGLTPPGGQSLNKFGNSRILSASRDIMDLPLRPRTPPATSQHSPEIQRHSPDSDVSVTRMSQSDDQSPSPKFARLDNQSINSSISPSKVDLNQNVKTNRSHETGSAFRKVCSSSQTTSVNVTSPIVSMSSLASPGALNLSKPSVNLSGPPKTSSFNGFSQAGPVSRNLPFVTAQEFPSDIGLRSIMSKSFGLAGKQESMGLRNPDVMNNHIPNMPFYPEVRMQMHYSYMKSQNPMVERLLTPSVGLPSSVSLSQNWCAKCNATFRMTSDLVYHMRTHHKGHTDPVKQKRAEKLKCNICGETFKERHHLTRHMTSHE